MTLSVLCKRWALAGLAAALIAAAPLGAAETSTSAAKSKTLVVIRLGAPEVLDVKSIIQQMPPGIIIMFPQNRVIGALPERATIANGVVQSIRTQYEPSTGSSPRFIRSLQLRFTGAYDAHATVEPGRVVVEIEHPASVHATAVDVGLRGGTILGAQPAYQISERFRAMQDALTKATPTPWAMQLESAPAPSSSARASSTAGNRLRFVPARPRAIGRPGPSASSTWLLWLCGMSLLAAGGVGAWFWRMTRAIEQPGAKTARPSSGMVLIDQLVWRAFERQGYQVISEQDLQPSGTMRIIAKDGSMQGLMCTGHGPFVEKHAVEQFARALRASQVEQGIFIAPGSFTVPAQRIAKAHRVTLIGREELTELLSAGAATEYMTTQLQQSQARLEDVKQTLQQYASELEALRLQRNEASWYLGEERAKSSQLDLELAQAKEQVQQQEQDLARWQQEATTLRKQWEESQWYLGESQAHALYLEAQLAALQEVAQEVERAHQQRDEATWVLDGERTAHQAGQTRLAELQQQVETFATRERSLQATLDQLQTELSLLRANGSGRRQAPRMQAKDLLIELRDDADMPVFTGPVRDVSSAGFGIQTDRALLLDGPVRARFRLEDDSDASFELTAHMVWERVQTARYQSGYQLSECSAASKACLERVVGESPQTTQAPD